MFALSGLVASTVIVSVLGLDVNSSTLAVIGGLAITLVVIMVGFSLFNASIERVAYRPLRHAPRLAPLITAVGMSFIVQNIALAVYGVNYRTVPNFIPRTNAIHIGDVVVLLEQGVGADHRDPAPRSASRGSSARRSRARR